MSPAQRLTEHRLSATLDWLMRRRTFELMDGRASLEEIAHKLAAEFPKRFSSWQQALSHAGLVSQEFSVKQIQIRRVYFPTKQEAQEDF